VWNWRRTTPPTVLDGFYKTIIEDKKKLDLKPGNLYQAAVYAWNALREDKMISNVKFDTKNGLYTITA
jgi:hypothetical protein